MFYFQDFNFFELLKVTVSLDRSIELLFRMFLQESLEGLNILDEDLRLLLDAFKGQIYETIHG